MLKRKIKNSWKLKFMCMMIIINNNSQNNNK